MAKRGPRIYHVLAQTVPADGWARLLDECAALGFNTLLLTPPFATNAEDDPYLVVDPTRLHPSLKNDAWGDDVETWLHGLAEMCSQHGLALWLDWMVGRFSSQASVVDAHPEWFRPLDQMDAPDPRMATSGRSGCMAVSEGAVDEVAQWWLPLLHAWRSAGIRGLCCRIPDALSAGAWQEVLENILEQDPDFRFMAWTPGLSASFAASLGDAGFDTAVCSLPWWDGRETWMGEELARLRRHFTCIVAPLPAKTRMHAESRQDEGGRRHALNLLTCASAFGDGWLLPAGMDQGRAWQALTDAHDAWDIRPQIASANAAFADSSPAPATASWQRISDACDQVDAWLERPTIHAEPGRLLLLNHDAEHHACIPWPSLMAAAACAASFVADATSDDDGRMLTPGEARLLSAHASPMACRKPRRMRELTTALHAPRIAIEAPSPCVDGGRFAVRRCVGETVEIAADVFCDGHELLAAAVVWRHADEAAWQHARMCAVDNDRFVGEITLTRVGMIEFSIEAWVDAYGSFRQALEKKHRAGHVEKVDIHEGLHLIDAACARSVEDAALHSLCAALHECEGVAAVDALLSPQTAALMEKHDDRPFLTRHAPCLHIESERRAARFASWYELFPRSQSNDEKRHGRFDDVMARLPHIADMGFDVLYLPPIHPIGRSKRKGRNNTPLAEPDDVGSPYAIGAAEGGHEALHGELGTLEDFHRLIQVCAAHGIELAMDFAIQCSPDHPWLKQHPEWFQWRSDGQVKHAENPPKVYEDIVNVDFYADGPAQAALWKALRDVVLFWVNHGVRLFRVDNPHTKPYPFWEWMIGDVRARHPDVVFLAEAFTRPKPMRRLARLGFSQSYTYFIWRNTKQELQSYFSELVTSETREYFRPHLFVNTPDINPEFLQRGGRPAFLIRAALACFLSGLWGMYSGFELCEAEALEGREEYRDAEKYQLRARNWNAPGNICSEIRQLNRLRHGNVELQSHLGLTFYNAGDPHVLYFGKRAPGHESMLLVAINLDPFADHASDIEVPLWEWQRPDDAVAVTHDLLHDHHGRWHGKVQHISLSREQPYAVWRIQPELA
ncbi:MAG TPA: maltotransferase domain-containing protein [Oleiagrimonas sp.]|nr:maltotransferase domain-containing protein [Oleiagrimonas sp.]